MCCLFSFQLVLRCPFYYAIPKAVCRFLRRVGIVLGMPHLSAKGPHWPGFGLVWPVFGLSLTRAFEKPWPWFSPRAQKVGVLPWGKGPLFELVLHSGQQKGTDWELRRGRIPESDSEGHGARGALPEIYAGQPRVSAGHYTFAGTFRMLILICPWLILIGCAPFSCYRRKGGAQLCFPG